MKEENPNKVLVEEGQDHEEEQEERDPADEVIKIEELLQKKGFDTGIIFPQTHKRAFLEVAVHFYCGEGAGIIRISFITNHLWAIYTRSLTDKVKDIMDELRKEYEVLELRL